MKRQANALTAVLENWQDVENAIDIYANSAGSALRENEIYLDSWEAKSKAVSAAWNELVNSLLDSNWIKGFLDGAQNVLSWLTNTNALIPVLAGLIGGVLTLAIQGLVKWIQGLKVALTEVNLLAGGIPLLIGLITTLAVGVVTWGINASDTAKQIENLTNKIEEQQKAIDDLNAKEKEATDLYKEYASLMSKSNAYGLSTEEKENLLKISNDLVDTYGLEVEGIDAVTGAYIIGANAINDYVEALRQERIEKQKEQTGTRNTRIDKNIGKIKNSSAKYDAEKLKRDIGKYINQNNQEDTTSNNYGGTGMGVFANTNKPSTKDASLNYLKNIDNPVIKRLLKQTKITPEDVAELESSLTKDYVAYSGVVNDIVKDIITNVQVGTADSLNSDGESLITQLLTPYLSSDSIDWKSFDTKDFEDKVSSFVSKHKGIIDNLINDTSETSKNIASSNVSVNDYKKYIENETTKANILASIIGGEEGKKEAQKIIDGLSNIFGAMMAEISNSLGENSGVFDKLTTEFLRLEQQFVSGKITFKEYTDGINKSLNSLDIKKTFGDSEESVKSFFSAMQTKGENVVKNIATEFQTGKTSLEDYMGQVEQISGYFISLGNKAASALGENSPISQSIKESSNNLSELLKELKLVQSAVKESSVSFEDFKKKPINSIESLVNKLLDLGITIQDLGGDATDSAKDIAKSLQSDTEAFAKMQTALATKTQSVLAQIGGSIGKILSGVKEYIKGFKVRFKVDLNPFDDDGIGIEPEVSGSAPVDFKDKKEYADRVVGIERDSSGKIINGWTQAKQDEFDKALKASEDEVYFGNLLSNSIDSNSLTEFISGLDGGDVSTYTPTNTDKDKDKTNEALDNYLKYAENRYKIHQDEAKYINDLQWAYNNLTKDAKERLDIEGKINEAYRDLADNRIKDLEHQIDLTKELKGENADVTKQLEEIQRVSHQEANRLRAMGYDDNSNEIQALQKTWWDAENQKLEWRLNDSKNWIEERNRLDDWHLFDDNEVKAWERVIKWLKEEYPHAVDEIKEAEENLFEARENNLNDILDEIQRHADNVADYYDKINDKLDERITKEEALLQIMQGQTDATSKLMDIQTEIDKALRDSKLSLQYLDEKERESIFNEEDYTKLSKLVKSTQNEIDSLSSRFYNDVIEAYEQDKAYLIESITAEYERQVAMKERELEIAQAQVDLTKKQLQLNNVLAEKNVKQLVERNGQYVWEWVADTDKVRQATEELMDAEAELKRQEYEQKQQEAIDEQQRRIDSIKAEQAANDYRVEKMNEYVDDLTKAIENCVDPIKSFEELAMQLGDAGGDIVAAFYNVVGSISGMGVKIPSTSSSSGGSGGGNSWMGNGKSYDTKTDYMSKILGASNKMDVVEYNNARNNKIDGEGMSEGKLSNSQAIKLWESAKNKHADGTRYTPGGMTLLGEEGFEAFINRNGNLIPIAQPTIGNIDSGGIVFNTEQMNNLRNLWDLSNIGKVNVDAALINRTIPSGNSGTQNTFTGGIIINAPRDYNDFVRQLTQRIKTKSI